MICAECLKNKKHFETGDYLCVDCRAELSGHACYPTLYGGMVTIIRNSNGTGLRRAQHKWQGSLWRDYNDHIFRLDSVVDDGQELRLEGTMMHCPDWCQMSHHADGKFYECWTSFDELEAGNIFGWARVWSPNGT